jgi:hypothetical protein
MDTHIHKVGVELQLFSLAVEFSENKAVAVSL